MMTRVPAGKHFSREVHNFLSLTQNLRRIHFPEDSLRHIQLSDVIIRPEDPSISEPSSTIPRSLPL